MKESGLDDLYSMRRQTIKVREEFTDVGKLASYYCQTCNSWLKKVLMDAMEQETKESQGYE